MTTIQEAGVLIAKYLRETGRLREEFKDKSDDEIGEAVFNSGSDGNLYLFFDLYRQADWYFTTVEDAKTRFGGKEAMP